EWRFSRLILMTVARGLGWCRLGCTPGSSSGCVTFHTPGRSWWWCANPGSSASSLPVVGDIHSGDRAAAGSGPLYDPAEDRTAGRGDQLRPGGLGGRRRLSGGVGGGGGE